MRRSQKQVSYQDAPHFTQPIHSVVACEGSSTAFEVVITGQKPISVNWLKDGVNCTENPNYEIEENDTENRYCLVISEVFDEDAGKFSCVARNAAGHASSTAELVVQGRPMPPSIEPMLVDQKSASGEKVTFEVNITGTPQPIVRWYREGAEIYSNQDFVIGEDGVYNTLTISRTYGEDSGDFTVAAVNVAGRATSTCHLEVEGSEVADTDGKGRLERGPAPATMPKPELEQEMMMSYHKKVTSKTSKKTVVEHTTTTIPSHPSQTNPPTRGSCILLSAAAAL